MKTKKKKGKGVVVSLDPRKARKLTDRECCSILSGFLGGMLTSDLVGPEAAREGLKLWCESQEVWNILRVQAEHDAKTTAGKLALTRSSQAVDASESLRMYWRGLASVISGLRSISHEKAVRRAILWIYVNDAWWPKKDESEAEAELEEAEA